MLKLLLAAFLVVSAYALPQTTEPEVPPPDPQYKTIRWNKGRANLCLTYNQNQPIWAPHHALLYAEDSISTDTRFPCNGSDWQQWTTAFDGAGGPGTIVNKMDFGCLSGGTEAAWPNWPLTTVYCGGNIIIDWWDPRANGGKMEVARIPPPGADTLGHHGICWTVLPGSPTPKARGKCRKDCDPQTSRYKVVMQSCGSPLPPNQRWVIV